MDPDRPHSSGIAIHKIVRHTETHLGSDHTLVCIKMSVGFDEHSKISVPGRLDFSELIDLTGLPVFREYADSKARVTSASKINEHWSNALHSAGLVNCGVTRRVLSPCISDESLGFLDARQVTPAGSSVCVCVCD